jgi:TRAP-type mannitol/chloroaromatic compound transport system permease small subunit
MNKNLLRLADFIDQSNNRIGKALGWVVLILIIVQISLIFMSGVFHLGSIKLQESLLYFNSLMFLAGGGYALLHDDHVRVDIFYREMPKLKQALVNLGGCLFLLFPFLIMLGIYAFDYASRSWGLLEESLEISGLPLVYILKSFILLFVITVGLQGVSLCIRSLNILKRKNDGPNEGNDE